MPPSCETRLECTRRKAREHYAANREQRAQYYLDNRETILAQQREYYAKNREAKLARMKKWREDNPEKVRAQSRKKCPKRAAAHHASKVAREAKKRGSEVKNCPRVRALYEIARCLRAEGRDVHVDHIYPLSKGGPHTFENLRILTAAENMAKSDKIPR